MGATGVKLSLGETKEMIVRDYNFVNNFREGYSLRSEVLAKANGKDGVFWLLRRIHGNRPDGTDVDVVTAECVIVKHYTKSGETVYKEINIASEPYYYDIPAKWFDKITDKDAGAITWLEQARKSAEATKALKAIELKPGVKTLICSDVFTLAYEMTPRKWAVRDAAGKLFRASVSDIKAGIQKLNAREATAA